jgi:hypothetical protein
MAVGYDQWKKERGEQLAAEEINEDIAKLQLFKPNDAELVSENKRLRAMLAEKDEAGHSVNPEYRVFRLPQGIRLVADSPRGRGYRLFNRKNKGRKGRISLRRHAHVHTTIHCCPTTLI